MILVYALWAIQVSEQVGTSDARRLLESPAKGAREAWLTQEAKASLQCLN
jgi:hypothetical protein